MAFGISVYLPEHLGFINQVPENPDEMDAWLKECAKLSLYDAPLDAGAVVYEYWSNIAHKLGLPLTSSIYDEGLMLKASDVPMLEAEMDKLEQYWEGNQLESVEQFEWTQSSAKKDLKERLNYLREAADVAKKNDAVLVIS